MSNYQFKEDEVILYVGMVTFEKIKSEVKLTLTNKNMIFEREKGIFRKKLKVIGTILLDNIKMHNDKVSIRQHKTTITVQTIDRKFSFTCSSVSDANTVVEEIINIKTGLNKFERNMMKIGKIAENVVYITNAVKKLVPIAKQLGIKFDKNTMFNFIKKAK